MYDFGGGVSFSVSGLKENLDFDVKKIHKKTGKFYPNLVNSKFNGEIT